MARKPTSLRAPFLKRVSLKEELLDGLAGFPYDLPIVRRRALEIEFTTPVTVVVGENGTGKSMILEAIAEAAGFESARESGRPHVFIFDEPESALLPKRQFEFLGMIRDLVADGLTQVIVATHSPVLMAYPDCMLLRLTPGSIEPCGFRETEHFQLLRQFYADPEGTVADSLEAG